MKKAYTNREKIEFYEKKLFFIQKRLNDLRQLPPDELSGQNFNSDLDKELVRKQLNGLWEQIRSINSHLEKLGG